MTREEAIEKIKRWKPEVDDEKECAEYLEGWFYKDDEIAFDMAIKALQEPPIGHWTDREVFTNDESPIEEWQSCCCSECGRYDTRPYMYFFKAPNYCSWCGANMEVQDE